MGYHYTSARMDKIKPNCIKYLGGYGAVGAHRHCWEYKLIQPLWKPSLSCKVEKNLLLMPEIPTLKDIPNNRHAHAHKEA